MVIHKYPVVGQTYVPIDPSERQPNGISSVKVLRTLDNVTFLAAKIPNTVCVDTRSDPKDKITVPLATCLLPTAATPISLLLNHPNIISIIDIVQNSQVPGRDEEKGEWSDITVWEDMNAGCLSYILPNTNAIPAFSDTYTWDLLSVENFHRFSLPESLCWHVLKSISRALLWLHHGLKETSGIPNDWQKHDDDWHAVLIMDVSPSQIWFKHPRGKETYGVCKLGGFGDARVCGSTGAKVAVANRKEDAPFHKKLYWPPELYTNSHSRASEVWQLGATVYTMMTGIPPPRDYPWDWQISRMNDKGFSKGIRDVAGNMLRLHPNDRTSSIDLVQVVDDEWARWRATTREGAEYVDVLDGILERKTMTRYQRGQFV